MRTYDPDWVADGRLDARRYPIHLIILFWTSAAACLIGVVGLPVSSLIAKNSGVTVVLFLVLAVGLGVLSFVGEKARTASRS